jgi:transglutaminase-like putative cysteine protease
VYLGNSAPVSSSVLLGIPSGVDGVRATLRIMRELVRKHRTTLAIREFAAKLVQHLPQKDWSGQVRALHEFVRDGVRYVKDVAGVETVQAPLYTLAMRYGDCDDKSTLLAALLASIGHPVRFLAIGAAPGRFSHVLVETLIGTRWIPLETTAPVMPGWAPRAPSKMRVKI